MKKAQLTIFMAIGLIVVLVLTMALFIVISNRENGFSLTSFTTIEDYMQACLETSSNNAINLAALQGGYTILDGGYLITPYQDIAYTLPELEEIESQINLFIEKTFTNCLDLEQFTEKGFNITYLEPKSSSTIEKNHVSIKLNFPVTLVKGSKTKNVNEFSYTVPARLGYVYDIVKSLREQGDWIDMTAVSELDVDVNIIAFDDHIIFFVNDKSSRVGTDTLRFLSIQE
ncbi:hypothetical protein KY330_03935 [Candidatus Woesearchaeota archaeon]|nr:hypothetical protein [Candidatus Woesearchaeota archaeon]